MSLSIEETLPSKSHQVTNKEYAHAHPGLIPNDMMLALSLSALLMFLFYEIYTSRGVKRKKGLISGMSINTSGTTSDGSNNPSLVPNSRRHVPLPQPVFQGVPHITPLILDATALCRYIPNKIPIYDIQDNENANTVSEEVKEDSSVAVVIGLPNIPGCELTSSAVDRMLREFPNATRADLVRFLVARKGNVDAAIEMFRKASMWQQSHLPLRMSPEVARAIGTRSLFPHGVDRDGAPVIYFRGSLYDSTKASSDVYVLAAAHAIDWALRRSNHCAITCLVHTSAVPGGPNEGADVNFIKGFVQTLSDNFPERLKRLAIYPFPWYGRALWSVVRVFVDKRTQDKVLLVSHSGGNKGLPSEILAIVDPSQIPECCGGTDTRPIVDIEGTLLPALEEPVAEDEQSPVKETKE